jgi:nucleotide-binding universal stress UspA family protein
MRATVPLCLHWRYKREGVSAMADVEDNNLLDLALGLRDDPQLERAVRRSPELRRRLRVLERDLRHLDGELRHLKPCDADDRRLLGVGRWRILLAIDNSEPSDRAVEAAASLAELSNGQILVLHAREIGAKARDPGLVSRAEAQRLVDGIADRLRRRGIRAQGETHAAMSGHAADDIADVARRIEADMIVMGSRGCSDLTSLLIGSVGHATIRRAGCPVLVCR